MKNLRYPQITFLEKFTGVHNVCYTIRYPRLRHSFNRLDFLIVYHVMIDDYPRIQIGLLFLEWRNFQKRNSAIDVTTHEVLLYFRRDRHLSTA